MTKPVHKSELGQAFWNNVRVENIRCRLFETTNDEGPPEGALQMGQYYSYYRPHNPEPLESSMTRTGRVCLQFHVKGSPESSVLKLKVDWTYVHHGQNRDSMLGKIMEPQAVEILVLLKQLKIPSSERQSADKLQCEQIAKRALSLLEGRVPRENNRTDQVHIIVKLHRIQTAQEKQQKWPDGNESDAVFLKGRRWNKYWRTFPQFLAFDEFALMTHDKSSLNLFPVTRRSVLVAEAKGDGTVLGKFMSDRLANRSRLYNEKETMQLVFKAFKFILQVQMHHLEKEKALLADLHENNITVMSDGNGGPLDVQFAFVDASGLLPVKGPKRADTRQIKAHLWCLLSIWSIVRVDKGHRRNHLSAYATQVWAKMQKTAEEFSQEFRRDCGWMPEQILRGLQTDVDDTQQRFLAGVSMQEQCRMMKQEAMAAAISRQQHQNRPRKETVWEDAWNAPTIPLWHEGRVPAGPGESRVPPKQGRVPFPHGTPPRQEVVQQKARPRPLPPASPPPWVQQGQVPKPKPLQKAPPTARVVKPQPMPSKAPPAGFVVPQQQGHQGPPTFAEGPGAAWIVQKAPPPEREATSTTSTSRDPAAATC